MVAVAVVGGFWPAVLAAITASLLVNWYFTPPVHTLTIGDGESLLALLLFITVAVTVSSVVHLAAHRARQAARSTRGGPGTAGPGPDGARRRGRPGRGAGPPDRRLRWPGRAAGAVPAGAVGPGRGQRGLPAAGDGAPRPARAARRGPPDLVLVVGGQARPLTDRLLHGFAAQAAAALDRDRLRTQAAQAEALAEGNRMRTALLAAVSHDLRTPLASIKASVSTLRQTDVTWTRGRRGRAAGHHRASRRTGWTR